MKLVIPPQVQHYVDQLQPYRTHLIAVGGCLLAGILVGVLRINVTSATSIQPEKWAMPQVTRPQLAPMPEELVTNAFWSEKPREPKKKAEPEQAKKPAGTWRLLGTVDHGAGSRALIEADGGKIQRLAVGDVLPDGAKVTDISEGSISFENEGDAQTRKLFVEKKPQ